MYEKTIGLPEQLAFMRLRWPMFNSRIRNGLLTCRGQLAPDAACATYDVSITYRGGDKPEVRVLEPQLRRRSDDEPIPHMYEHERLCLYLPGVREWTPGKQIATTIVPWTSLWLFFYEVWLATGEWMGGGVEPGMTRPIRREPNHDLSDSTSI
jgi:hypothetical protein